MRGRKILEDILEIRDLRSRIGIIWPEDESSYPVNIKNMDSKVVDCHGLKLGSTDIMVANWENCLVPWFPHHNNKSTYLLMLL